MVAAMQFEIMTSDLPEASPDLLSLSDLRLSYILLGDSISVSVLLVEPRFLAAKKGEVNI